MGITRDELVARLKRAGELQISGESQAEVETYFNVEQFRFHAPDGLRRITPASPTISRPFGRRSMIAQSVEALLLPRQITLPARRGSRGHLSASSHSHLRAP